MTRHSLKTLLASLLLLTAFAAAASAQDNFLLDLQKITDNKEKLGDSARLHQLFDVYWKHTMYEYPEWATYVGYPGQNGRWTDVSLKAMERRNGEVFLLQKTLHSINRTNLNVEDKLNYDLSNSRINRDIEGLKFKGEYLAISPLGGVHQDGIQLLNDMPTTTVKECEDILSRLRGYPAVVDQNIALLEEGLKTGITPAKITLPEVPQQVLNQIVENPADAPILGAFKELPATIPPAEQERIRKEAYQTYSGQIVPALQRFHQFLTTKYINGCRETIGCSNLPDGQA
ncbi:MAG TPA: DUF885 family protein, partial [candidate division Zixibacteria bacterium]|nr:DUF885 family protein [candidate division Zixibacteria bacterium]